MGIPLEPDVGGPEAERGWSFERVADCVVVAANAAVIGSFVAKSEVLTHPVPVSAMFVSDALYAIYKAANIMSSS